RADVIRFRAKFRGGLNVVLAGPVAALAIDALGKLAGIDGLIAEPGVARRDGFVTVVAEDAVVSDGALAIDMVGRVITGSHPPVAALFGIPGDRQLQQASVGGAMQIGARMNGRAEE